MAAALRLLIALVNVSVFVIYAVTALLIALFLTMLQARRWGAGIGQSAVVTVLQPIAQGIREGLAEVNR